MKYEMLLPSNVDFNIPAYVVDCGALPYQAVLLATRQNTGGSKWMSRPAEEKAVAFIQAQRETKQHAKGEAPTQTWATSDAR